MSIEELEEQILRLDPSLRARLARRLLSSLEELSEEESAKLWLEEAKRRDAEMQQDAGAGRAVADALRDARRRFA